MRAAFLSIVEIDSRRFFVLYAIALLIVIFMGLGSRMYPQVVPEAFGNYPGDALWATAIYLGWCFILRSSPPAKVFVITVLICWGIEFSQLYQEDWIRTIRSNPVGRLMLGSHFHGLDLPVYTIGAAIGWAIDFAIISFAVRKQEIY